MRLKLVNNWINIIQDYWLPPTCILCEHPGANRLDLCQDCFENLPRFDRRCFQCAARLPETHKFDLICGDCQIRRPAFDRTLAFYEYRDSMRYLIGQLKFHRQYSVARLLGLLIAGELIKQDDLPEAIIPVPLHPKRYQERHFNQSLEIAKTVSAKLKIPLFAKHCVRQRNTAHQTQLSKNERLKNMRNAFSIAEVIPAQHVAILDDVMTTGSTLHELAAVLKKSGVQRVDAWVCART